jgi:hypothetical protein
MKKIILVSLVLLIASFAMSSCSVLNCQLYDNSLTYSADQTKARMCVECTVKNKELLNNIINLKKTFKMNQSYFHVQKDNPTGKLFIFDEKGNFTMESSFNASFVESNKKAFKEIDISKIKNVPVQVEAELFAENAKTFVLADPKKK